MKALSLLSALLGTISVASFVYAIKSRPEPVSAPTAERLGVYVVEPEKHLGVVGLHEQVRGSFTVVNDSDATITLGEPLKSCSCTTAELDRRELAPGERCSLTFAIQTGNRRGPRAETVSVIYTTPNGNGTRQVFAKVYFVPKGVFEIDPGSVTLTRAQPKVSFTIHTNPSADRRTVLDVRSNHRCVKVDTHALPVLTLELDLETPDESILNTECIVYTNNPAEETISVPVRVRKE